MKYDIIQYNIYYVLCFGRLCKYIKQVFHTTYQLHILLGPSYLLLHNSVRNYKNRNCRATIGEFLITVTKTIVIFIYFIVNKVVRKNLIPKPRRSRDFFEKSTSILKIENKNSFCGHNKRISLINTCVKIGHEILFKWDYAGSASPGAYRFQAHFTYIYLATYLILMIPTYIKNIPRTWLNFNIFK
jgi:hypothetical protein